jgi:hypothetical protein
MPAAIFTTVRRKMGRSILPRKNGGFPPFSGVFGKWEDAFNSGCVLRVSPLLIFAYDLSLQSSRIYLPTLPIRRKNMAITIS